MKFYFCEACGKRVTDEELAHGQGANKQVRGIYCSACAQGVRTVNFDAIQVSPSHNASTGAQTVPNPHLPGEAKALREGPRCDASVRRLVPARRSSDAFSTQLHRKEARHPRPQALIFGSAAGLAILLMLAASFLDARGRDTPSPHGKAREERGGQGVAPSRSPWERVPNAGERSARAPGESARHPSRKAEADSGDEAASQTTAAAVEEIPSEGQAEVSPSDESAQEGSASVNRSPPPVQSGSLAVETPSKHERIIETNKWEHFKPQLTLRRDLDLNPESTKTGGYGYNNMWGAILYRECANEIILFDGWNGSLEGQRIGYTSIYANALYGVDPVTFKMTQHDILRWRRGDNGMTEHPSNRARPTPWPRHTAGTMAYAPTLDKIFLYRGAAMHGAPDPLWEFWEYSFKEDAWNLVEQDKGLLPPRGNKSLGYLGNTFIFHPDKDTSMPGMLCFFEGTAKLPVWVYNLSTQEWTKRSDQIMPVNVGFAASCVDAKRRRILFVGGNSGDMYDDLDRCLIWAYYFDSDKWEKVVASGDIPSGRKKWMGVCIDSEQDYVIAYGGDESLQTSVFRLKDNTWRKLDIMPAAGPGIAKGRKKLYTYIAFDLTDRMVILQQNDEWFRIKLDIQEAILKP